MTEIPEHLLKRSKARRAAIGGGGDAEAQPEAEGGDAAAAGEGAAAPATTGPAPAPAAAVPAEPAPPPEPEPVRPEVAAYQNRRRVPYWALPVLAFLPLWAYLFQGTLEPPATGDEGPLALGGEIYASQCAACHGGGGQGIGAFPALDDVVDHWPDPLDQMMWVRVGSTGWPGDTLGVSDIPSAGGMPGFSGLSEAQLAEVVLYERVTHAGLDPESDDALLLVAIAEGETTFEEAGLGELSSELGVSEAELASP